MIMFLKTTQKYFSMRNKFSVVDENDRQFYFAQSYFKIRQNCSLYTLEGSLVYELECKIFSLFGKYFIKDVCGNVVGLFSGRIHKPFVQKWRLDLGDKKYILRTGGLRCKVFAADENWKYDSKTDFVGKIYKRWARLRDTYEFDFDETRIMADAATLCMLWMDCRFHGEHH